MVDYQTKIRTKLQTKVFDVIGKTVTFINKSTPIYNERGELDTYSTSSVSVKGVPYNIMENKQSYQRFGNLAEGEMDMAIPYDTVVNIDDQVTVENINYNVKDIHKNYLPENVVTIIRLTKI